MEGLCAVMSPSEPTVPQTATQADFKVELPKSEHMLRSCRDPYSWLVGWSAG